jgi:predicted XRE-type DNA-binding protein
MAIRQQEVSHLLNCHFSRVTTEKLLDFLKRLDRKVTIHISQHKPGEPYQVIRFGM